jgi:hypothetical protein
MLIAHGKPWVIREMDSNKKRILRGKIVSPYRRTWTPAVNRAMLWFTVFAEGKGRLRENHKGCPLKSGV